MKLTKTKLFSLTLAAALLTNVIAARAQVTSGTIGSFTNTPNVFTLTNAVAATNELTLTENTGLALMTRFASPATAAVGSGMWIWFSVDGTNYPATPIQLTVNGNGGTYVLVQTNWSAAQLSGYARLRVQLTNANANNITNNIIWRRWNSPAR